MNSTALEAILDVAIGMIFMWLVLSIATMSVQEWIATYLKWRAKDLETAVQRLLGDEVWAEKLYEHPLVRALSKKPGKKPSYMPANKFALALYDIVMTAGTPASLIQDKLLAAKHELDIAPNQIGPLIAHIFKRARLNLSNLFTKVLYFFGAEKGTQGQRFAVILREVETLFHSSSEEDELEQDVKSLQEKIQAEKEVSKVEALEDELAQVEKQLRSVRLAVLKEKLEKFILLLLNDQIEIEEGKEVPISSVDFFDTYPVFQKFFFELLDQTNLRLRWAENMVNGDEARMEELINTLPEGMNLRYWVRQAVQEKAQASTLNKKDLESLFDFVQQSFGSIDFTAMAEYISGLAGNAEGLAALAEVNPTLHKSLEQLYDDIIGIANNTNMMEAVRTRFAIAAVNLEKTEHNLAALRLNSETWFNESMDRLGGWYKRKATLLAFVIGLVLAAFLNVDSIILAEHLWKEPTLRQALVANATQFTVDNPNLPEDLGGSSPQDAITYFNTQFSGLEVPLGWKFKNTKLEAGQKCSLIPIGGNVVWGIYAQVPESQLEEKIIQEYSGEDGTQPEVLVPVCQQISNFPDSAAGIAMKLLGIVFSAGAAAQGAPFWFDILKKLVNIRGSGSNPDEKSK